jgi:hypothetical protein
MRVIDKDTGEEFDLDSTDELSADLRRWDEAECTHPATKIRSTIVSNGGIHYRKQCQLCGELVEQAISKALVLDGCPPKDEILLANHRAERRQQREELIQKHVRKQKAHGSEWGIKYNTYLRTPEWRRIAGKVLQRAGGVCEGCGEARATQVHHRSYAHVFEEFLFELVAVCDGCHDRLHQEENPLTDEWQDGFPCAGCRFQDERGHRRWCGVFDVLAVEALSIKGQRGPAHAGFEPMK